MHALRFLALTGALLAVLASLLAGGVWLWTGAAMTSVTLAALDELIGDEHQVDNTARARLLEGLLYVSLPLLVLVSALYATYLSTADPFGLIAGFKAGFGLDLAQRRLDTSLPHLIGGGLSLAAMFGACGVVVGHEFIHRLGRPASLVQGYLLLGFTCDTTYAVSHVFGHHRNVGDPAKDPATARRGENFYAFLLRSIAGQFREAFLLEAERRHRHGKPPYGIGNPVLAGLVIPVAYTGLFAHAAGWTGAAVFLAMAAGGKISHQAVSYVQHYGLERAEGAPLSAHHTWDSARAATNSLLYNAARHADHHLHMGRPYHRLELQGEAPRLPYGYGLMLAICYLPPLWTAVMHKPLAQWDARHPKPEATLSSCRGANLDPR